MHLRPATQADLELLIQALHAAYNWTGEERFGREVILTHPKASLYVAGWMRADDFGLVAVEDVESPTEETTALGVIWARLLTGDAPGYGYVADDIPEISMAVSPAARGRGVGTALLSGCLAAAAERGFRAVSLSVEDGNDTARGLYERFGFRAVGRDGTSDTMLADLTPAR
jgi:ribosomal protein S18 acetylase RimI-like enzyme